MNETTNPDTLHAVRFAHDSGMIFSEPIPRKRARQLVERLAAMGLPAKLLAAGEESDVQSHFSRAQWDDRCVLVVPGIGTIALVRVPIDIVLPERQPATPAAAIATAAGEDDWPDDVVVEMTPAGRDLAGLSGDKPPPCLAPTASAKRQQSVSATILPGGGQLIVGWLTWTIYVLAGALWTAEGVVTAWFCTRSAPQPAPQRPRRKC